MRTPVIAALLAAGFCALEIVAMAQAPSPAISAAANVPPAPSAAPKIQFASTVYDFGRVVENEVVRVGFTFTNMGDTVLEIAEVRPTCGCTTAGAWDRRIEPGKSGVIPLQFNSKGYLNAVTKSVTVESNDPARSNVVLQIKAFVWRPINVTPTTVVFALTSDAQTNETRIARITNNEEQPLVLSPPVSDQRVFKPEIKTNQPGKEYELVVGLVPPMTTSNIAGSITIRTSSTNTPLLTVTAVATIQPPVAALPAQLVLPAGPMATKRQLGVYVRNNESTPITVSEPRISLTNVQVQLQEFQKGRLFRVVCDFPENFELAPGERGQLTVKTSNPQVPVLQIPIIVRAAPPALSPANVLARPISSVAPAFIRTNERPLVPDSSSARPSPRRDLGAPQN